MDTFGTNELRRLTGQQAKPCVSVYLPTHVAGEQRQQDPVRLKNLLQRAEEQLAGGWMRTTEARQFLKAARDLPAEPPFWNERSDGLAIFVAPGSFHCYRLPVKFSELVHVNRRFHVKPLLPLLTAGDRFFILALSQNKVRLFSASRYSIEQVDVKGLAMKMDDALNYVENDRGSQVHTATRGSQGKQAAVFHGHGGQADRHKDDLTQFFRLIDAALQVVLRDESTPLLLAGVEYLLPKYRDVNSYSHVIGEALIGNCDRLTAHQLHEKAWPLIEPVIQQARDDAASEYGRLAGTAKASRDIRQILPAGHEGKIDTLFVDVQAHQWGLFDPSDATVELHDSQNTGDDDLLDLAAVETLSHGGTVYSVEREHVPNAASAAAIFRY